MLRISDGYACVIASALLGFASSALASQGAPELETEGPPVAQAEDSVTPPETAADEAAAPELRSSELAQRLFREGEEAYWLGDFDRAIDRFEEAYKLSRVPGMLYNVGLAYQRRFETSRSVEDLKRARAVFVNYLDADTGGLVDPRHVEAVLAEIDTQLAIAEAPKAEPGRPEEGEISEPLQSAPSCPDPVVTSSEVDRGQKSRLVGGAVMATGGLLLSGGIVSLTAFSLKGREFKGVLGRLEEDQRAAGCSEVQSSLCDDLQRSREITVRNGYKANILAGAVGGSLMAVGVGGLVAGALLYYRGKRYGRRAEVVLTPTLAGAALVGRF
ncbi:MAG TPA: hypothetical protein ENJ18_12940 [Nannocystis exedens]|nr:hypothetical protein [Nannocystis exedens]